MSITLQKRVLVTQAKLQLTRRSLAEQVSEALVDLILDTGLQEGDALPSTADLSERFGVSRTVIREALAALAGRGVLTRSQGRESVVATPGAEDLMRLLQFRVHRDDVELADIIDVRTALEETAARRAAENATDEDIVVIREHLDTLANVKSDAAYHRADIALHRAIAVASGNPLVVMILDSLVDFLRQLRVTATKKRQARGESLEPVFEQHRAIVEAIAAHDGDAAVAAMRDHLATASAELD